MKRNLMLGCLAAATALTFTGAAATAQVAPGTAVQQSRGPGFRLPDSLQSLNDVYPGLQLHPPPVAAPAEFRPIPRAPWMHGEPDHGEEAARTLRATTAWQRLRDFRSRVGVRVLTLWESPGSTISLQAGKRGGPSLQWSSRVVGHGDEASRGLLDQLLAATTGGLRRSATFAPPAGPADRVVHPASHPAEARSELR
jgi:hypothetical protein